MYLHHLHHHVAARVCMLTFFTDTYTRRIMNSKYLQVIYIYICVCVCFYIMCDMHAVVAYCDHCLLSPTQPVHATHVRTHNNTCASVCMCACVLIVSQQQVKMLYFAMSILTFRNTHAHTHTRHSLTHPQTTRTSSRLSLNDSWHLRNTVYLVFASCVTDASTPVCIYIYVCDKYVFTLRSWCCIDRAWYAAICAHVLMCVYFECL